MFSDKLKYYHKPCGWLKFLLNFWWPATILLTGSTVVESIVKWNPNNASGFVWCLLSCVILLCADLLARFLDKTSFFALLGALAFRGVFWLYTAIDLLIPEPETPLTGNFLGDVFNRAVDGLMIMIAIMSITILIITILSAVYIIRRKDLFIEEPEED